VCIGLLQARDQADHRMLPITTTDRQLHLQGLRLKAIAGHRLHLQGLKRITTTDRQLHLQGLRLKAIAGHRLHLQELKQTIIAGHRQGHNRKHHPNHVSIVRPGSNRK